MIIFLYYLSLWINRFLQSRRIYLLIRAFARTSLLTPRTLPLIRIIRDLLKPIAHFKRLITCKAQKQDPTLPHVYSTGRLLVEVFDTKVTIRAQDRPHSRFLNLASLPISRIIIIALVCEFSRRKREKKSAASLLYSSIGFPGDLRYTLSRSIGCPDYVDRRDRSSTEVRARLKPLLPFRSARTFARSTSLREEFSRASPNSRCYRVYFLNPKSHGSAVQRILLVYCDFYSNQRMCFMRLRTHSRRYVRTVWQICCSFACSAYFRKNMYVTFPRENFSWATPQSTCRTFIYVHMSFLCQNVRANFKSVFL